MMLARLRLRTKREKFLLFAGVVLLALVLLHVFRYNDSYVGGLLLAAGYSKVSGKQIANKVLFPARFEFDEAAIRVHLHNTSSKDWGIVRMRDKEVKPLAPITSSEFQPHLLFSLYGASALHEENQCDAAANVSVDSLQVSGRTATPFDLREILSHITAEHDLYHDQYYKDLEALLMSHVRQEFVRDLMEPFWFRQSGSSVWLKDYNVHFVVSQLIFTTTARKTDPLVSLTLAQIFDEDWNELKDVRLVIPTGDVDNESAPVFKIGSQSFSLLRFPLILPVPFYHDYGKNNGNHFGTEDPKVLLVKNPGGYEEPMIVFNAHHIMSEKKKDSDDREQVSYRSMFFSLPFQLQKGKGDVRRNRKADHIWFSKTQEVHVQGEQRQQESRDWTPMLTSFGSSGLDEYDDTILFVTLLEPLRIVRCDLYSGNERCYNVFHAEGLPSALHGGTPFINVKSLVSSQYPELTKRIFLPGREVFVGIANNRLEKCGCGSSFDRPSIVAITKDQASYYDHKKKEDRTKFYYRVSHVSSSLDLGVELAASDVKNKEAICENINSIIPVGIGSWNIHNLSESRGIWNVDDTLTLGISVFGNTVDQISVKGVLNAVFNTYGNTIFTNPHPLREEQFLGLPELDQEGALVAQLPGIFNTNINCALTTSREYCKSYGENKDTFAHNIVAEDTSSADKQFEKDFADFKAALREAKKAE